MTKNFEPIGNQLPQLATKLSPPGNRAPLVHRSKILETLSASRLKKLSFIKAPAGFGKTTVLTQLWNELIKSKNHVAWLSLDEDDNDFNHFLLYVTTALEKTIPGICSGTKGLLQAERLISEKMIISTLINELSGHDSPIFIFLDDYHFISENVIHNALDYLLIHIPANTHLIIASRREAPLCTARLKTLNQLVEIDVSQLRFTLNESDLLLNKLTGFELTNHDISKLHNMTEGWPGGLQLASISLHTHKDKSAFINSFSGNLTSVRNFLASDVLEQQPEELVSFLLKTSILKQMNSDLCNSIADIDNSTKMLDILETNNLFLFPLDENRQWYRYHHLFSTFLKQRLETEFPRMVPELHLKAYNWFKNRGQTDTALYHAFAAGKISLAADLIEESSMILVKNGYMNSFLGLVKKLPDNLLRRRDKLKIAKGWALCLTNRPREAEEFLNNFISDDDSEDIRIEEGSIRAVCASFTHNIILAEKLASKWMEQSMKKDPWVIATLGNVLTHANFHLGNFYKAREIQMWTRKYQKSAAGITSELYGRGLLGLIHTAQARLHGAEKHYRQAIQVAKSVAGEKTAVTSMTSALMFDLLFEWDRLDEAEKLIEGCLDLIEIGCHIDVLIACYIPLSRFLALKNKYEESLLLLNRLEEVGEDQGSQLLLSTVLHEKIRIMINHGELQRAAILYLNNNINLNKKLEKDQISLDVAIIELEKKAEARIFIAKNELIKAIEILGPLVEVTGNMKFFRRKIELQVLLSVAYNMAGHKDKALNCLSDALFVTKPQNMIRTFTEEGREVKTLLEILAKQSDSNATKDYLNKIIKSFDSNYNNLPDQLPEPLNQREIEILEIMAKGLLNKEIANVLDMTINNIARISQVTRKDVQEQLPAINNYIKHLSHG